MQEHWMFGYEMSPGILFLRHRYFPLLKFMFEKCEQATLNPDSLNNYDIKMPTTAFHSSASSHRSRQPMASSSSTEGFRRFDDELKMFMIENQHILLNENTGSSNNSEKVSKINKMLDEVVRYPTPL